MLQVYGISSEINSEVIDPTDGNNKNNKGKKIAFIYMSDYDKWPFGGMLTYVKNILPTLSKIIEQRGDALRLYGCKAYDGESHGDAYIPITRIRTGFKIIPNSLRYGLAIVVHRNLFRDVDIVYSHTETATIALRLINKNCKIIHHQHGLSYKSAKDLERFHNFERWLAQCLADEVLVVASEKAVEEHGRDMGAPKKFHAIGSPIPFDRIRQTDSPRSELENTIRFIYTGRLNSHKNVRLALEAYAIFHAAHPDSKFTIIGNGPDKETLQAWVTDNIKDKSVVFLGKLESDSVYRNLSSSDILLFPSNGEGVSLSVLEALAAGLPVVCRDVIGLRDLVVDGKTGIISKSDTVEGFAEAIECAARSFQAMRTNCIDFASDYSESIIAHKIANYLYA